MRIKCNRAQLLIFVPLLIGVSIVVNGFLFLKHHKSTVQRVASTAESGTGGMKAVAEFFGQDNRGPKNKRKNTARRNKNQEKKLEPVVPTPDALSPNATFSACLLIKDDNEILNEWLAYHYHVLNLRHLIVAVDPLSSEQPSGILGKWRNLTDMEVLEWTDAHYMPADFLSTGKPPRKYMQKKSDFDYDIAHAALVEISNHRYRQRVFLAKCMKALRQKGNTWVIHIDTDEYVVASKLLRQMKPDYVKIKSVEEKGSVLNLLQQAVRKTSEQISYPCVSMLRVLFGSVEMPDKDREKDVPPGFNATTFESLRWRYHALPHNMTYHGNPKVILDVSAIPEKYFPDDLVYSIHRPVERYCHKNKELTFTNFRKQPIAVNHYLGSWERYNGRNDKRRSREKYDARAQVKRGKDDGTRPWLRGFVRSVGFELASTLLGSQYLAPVRSQPVVPIEEESVLPEEPVLPEPEELVPQPLVSEESQDVESATS